MRRSGRVLLPALVALALVVMVVVAVGLLTRTTTTRYRSFAPLDTPADRFAAAELVVVADIAPTDQTVRSLAIYPVYRPAVRAVLKGVADADLRVAATSPSETEGRLVDEADVLAGRADGVLYLTAADVPGVWQLVVPGAVDPVAVADRLPSE